MGCLECHDVGVDMSHAAGVGGPLPEEVVRATMAVRAQAQKVAREALAMLGDAYAGTGDRTKAIETYDKIVSSPLGRLNNAYIYVTAHYDLGKLCQDMGLKDKARENFTKFLGFWKNADPGIREVEDAGNED